MMTLCLKRLVGLGLEVAYKVAINQHLGSMTWICKQGLDQLTLTITKATIRIITLIIMEPWMLLEITTSSYLPRLEEEVILRSSDIIQTQANHCIITSSNSRISLSPLRQLPPWEGHPLKIINQEIAHSPTTLEATRIWDPSLSVTPPTPISLSLKRNRQHRTTAHQHSRIVILISTHRAQLLRV